MLERSNSRCCTMLVDTCIGAGKYDKVILTVVEVVQASFITTNVLKFNFHNCRGSLMVVDSCFRAGKIRYSRFNCPGGLVDVVQVCFTTSNV